MKYLKSPRTISRVLLSDHLLVVPSLRAMLSFAPDSSYVSRESREFSTVGHPTLERRLFSTQTSRWWRENMAHTHLLLQGLHNLLLLVQLAFELANEALHDDSGPDHVSYIS